jgi:ribosomal protein L24E
MRSRRLALFLTSTVLASAGTLIGPPAPAGAALAQSQRWVRSAPGGWFAWSSPTIGDINGDGSNDVVVGGQDGRVYAWDANGNVLPGWPATAMASVASSPAIGDLDGDGRNEVVVGAGSLEVANQQGGLMIFNSDGRARCSYKTSLKPDLRSTAVFNAPAIGDIDGDGRKDVVFGSFNHTITVIGSDCKEKGRYDNTDSVWSAPALYDVDRDGAQEIFIGGDATENPNVKGDSHNGGYFRSLRYNGTPTLFERWQRTSVETFQSGASVGDVNNDGRLEVVTGAGAYYCRHKGVCGDSNKVWAFHLDDGTSTPGWPKTATHNTTFLSAPALGDIDGDGRTDVVVGSNHYSGGNPTAGALDAFPGNGGPRRTFPAPSDVEITASPVIADVDGSGTNEVVIGTSGQLYVLDGNLAVKQSGLALGSHGINHKSAAAVGELGPGRWAVVSSGFDSARNGHVYAYDIRAPRATPWPMLQKNARRLGADPTDALPIHCDTGYRLVAADGGIFAFGDASYHGSTGNIRLNQPIVGMAAHKSGKGYWLVARDGGIFSFGEAKFHGSTGNIVLNQPIVGMAAHQSGQGYWFVAADGGMFAFGNAKFHGSTGDIRLNQPIVGMAATPSGNGYWLVARDGGIFAFGDAKFHGSTGDIRLNQPIVGMAAHQSGQGYWFVAADGGIFSFGNAEFHGSTGHLRLNRPVVGMRPTPTGKGYWFVATDGGIFSFGDAQFCGSTGRLRLNFPIVGMD